LKRVKWWCTVAVNIIFVVSGHIAGTLLLRLYFQNGGNKIWMGSLVCAIGFPVMLIPYLFLLCRSSSSSSHSPPPYSLPLLATMYLILGAVYAAANTLATVGLSYLSASTFALILTSQLGFISLFFLFINRKKMTVLVVNSVVILALSSSLLGVDSSSANPSGVSRRKYLIGVFSSLGCSALYALYFSLAQVTFERVRNRQTYISMMELWIWTSVVATLLTLIGFFASGQWRTITGEMDNFTSGRVSYAMTIVWCSISWQVSNVGQIGLVFIVSSLFSDVIGIFSLAVIPIAAVIFFHDKMDGLKIIAMLLAFWGTFSYIYQHYIDDVKARK
ncbi:hypothetical protein M569_14894, partial [Genlisea aurea]